MLSADGDFSGVAEEHLGARRPKRLVQGSITLLNHCLVMPCH